MLDYVELLLWELLGWMIGVIFAIEVESMSVYVVLAVLVGLYLLASSGRLLRAVAADAGIVTGILVVLTHGRWVTLLASFFILSIPLLMVGEEDV